MPDAFLLFEQSPRSWSWWDYRQLAFRKNQGLRIDHILVSEPLRAFVRSCEIDKARRKLERYSRQIRAAAVRNGRQRGFCVDIAGDDRGTERLAPRRDARP